MLREQYQNTNALIQQPSYQVATQLQILMIRGCAATGKPNIMLPEASAHVLY
jgi:hypothetical protein